MRSAKDSRHNRVVWLFDLDNTLHDASAAVFGPTNQAMAHYIAEHLKLPLEQADTLRQHYWERYGATLLGLVRHHGVDADHFLHSTHQLPGLEQRLSSSSQDRAFLRRLPGRKIILTNAPRAYALRVLKALGLSLLFERVIGIEDMRMFGHWRAKPDRRMLRHIATRLKALPHQCVLVEDTLQHQRAACQVGMRSVWMQRYIAQTHNAAPTSAQSGTKVFAHLRCKPMYTHVKIRSLRPLRLMTRG
jgi:putative hydrolase of the HAD superfamily